VPFCGKDGEGVVEIIRLGTDKLWDYQILTFPRSLPTAADIGPDRAD